MDVDFSDLDEDFNFNLTFFFGDVFFDTFNSDFPVPVRPFLTTRGNSVCDCDCECAECPFVFLFLADGVVVADVADVVVVVRAFFCCNKISGMAIGFV